MRTIVSLLLPIALLSEPARAGIFTSIDVPKPIYDFQTTQSTVTVPSMTIWDVNVIIGDLRHTWTGDLRIWIQSPVGTSVLLFDRRGGSGDNLIGTIFDDSAPVPVASGSAPFAGSFQPEQPLSVLVGQNAGGVWTLYVSDLAGLDEGWLNSWSLEINGTDAVPEPSTLALVTVGLLGAGLLRRRLA